MVIYPQIGDEAISNPARYVDGRIDGLLVRCVLRREHPLLESIDPTRLPLVALWSQTAPPGVGFADIDHYGGALLAIEHLLSLGHRRIGYADPEKGDGNMHFTFRYQGYRDALSAAGIAAHPECSAVDPSSVLRLLEQPDPVTAIFAPQDLCAARLIEWLRGHGVRVPEDLSVVGFDDFPNASPGAGGLTTVHQPITAMTIQAVRSVLALIAGAPVEQCRSLVPAHLVVRHTTAPPADLRDQRRTTLDKKPAK